MSYNTAAIRKLLIAVFNDAEYAIFCYDNFRPVYENFTDNMPFLWKVQLLIDYCERYERFDELLAQVQEINPVQYSRFISLLEPPHPIQQATPTTSLPKNAQETNFYGSVTGPVHTGSGHINVTHLFSLKPLISSVVQLLRWSEAPEHMRSSWAGMVIWSLSTMIDRLTPRYWLLLLGSIGLWVATTWLLVPIYQWPLGPVPDRLIACAKYAFACLAIPLFVGVFSTPDYYADFELNSPQQRRTLLLLKLAGAYTGFWVFSAILLGLALILYYLNFFTLPRWGWSLLTLVPLLFSYVVARRIPADRYKMYGSSPQMHEVDKLILAMMALVGPGLALFLYFWYDFLANQSTGFILLLALIGIVLWEQRKRVPHFLSDSKAVFLLGLILPLSILSLAIFLSDQVDRDWMLTANGVQLLVLALAYVLGPILLWLTLLIRNKPVLTWQGTLGLLLVALALNGVLLIHLTVGRWLTLAILALWAFWGSQRFRRYLWIHPSWTILLALNGLSFYLAVRTLLPLWINALGLGLLLTGLVWWAYHSKQMRGVHEV